MFATDAILACRALELLLQKCLLAVSHGSGARGSLPRALHKDLNLQAKIYIHTAINYTEINQVHKFIITGAKYYTDFNYGRRRCKHC